MTSLFCIAISGRIPTGIWISSWKRARTGLVRRLTSAQRRYKPKKMVDVFTSSEFLMFQGMFGIPILVRDVVSPLLTLMLTGRILAPLQDIGFVCPKFFFS